jgi:uncharacterized phage protein (TIGR02218 family)
MPRYIPLALADHLAQPTTTTCYLLRVDPVNPLHPSYGVTTLDRAVVYDDGAGELVYSAAIGAQPTALVGADSLSVDNAESTSLMPEFDVPVSEADIRAGVYDFARFSLYLVNYESLSDGHVLLRSGSLGRITIDVDGLSFVNELRGLSAELKQSVCEKDSLACRATFGSQPGGSVIAGPIERFPCGVDATALLIDGAVTAVGLENTLTFTVSGFTLDDDELNPGMAFWLTGLNAGRSNEIDTNTATGVITLAHETMWPIQVGDTLQYRVDCNKLPRDTVKGCKAPIRWGDEWPIHFRGEPDIPIGDAGAMETPGASGGPGQGGYTSQPQEAE